MPRYTPSEPMLPFHGHCAGCKEFALIKRVDSWRYRCNDCIAREAMAECERQQQSMRTENDRT
jgi:hypothetical protein